MNAFKWLIPIACVSASLMAQSATDLNGLVSAAAHYVSDGMSSVRDPETLALSKIVGNNGAPDGSARKIGFLCPSKSSIGT